MFGTASVEDRVMQYGVTGIKSLRLNRLYLYMNYYLSYDSIGNHHCTHICIRFRLASTEPIRFQAWITCDLAK